MDYFAEGSAVVTPTQDELQNRAGMHVNDSLYVLHVSSVQ